MTVSRCNHAQSGSDVPLQARAVKTRLIASLPRCCDQQNFDKVAASIDALAVNIAQLTAQQKVTANNLDKLGEKIDRGFDRCVEAINGHLAVSQSQSVNIAELTKLLTAIVSHIATS